MMSNSMAARGRPHHHRGGRNSAGMNNRPNHSGGRRPEPREPKTAKAGNAGIHGNARLMHAFMHLMGYNVTVTTKNNQKYAGLLHCVNKDGNIILSGATCITTDNSDAVAVHVSDHMILEKDTFVSVEGKGIELDNGREFATDQVIAQRSNGQITGEKELEPWDGGDDDALPHETLEASSDANGWTPEDMFQCNETKFNLSSSYQKDMPEYTTPLPTVKDETYWKRCEIASNIAHSIENDDQSRRQIDLENGDEDEEAKFSAVHRPGQSAMRDIGGGSGKQKGSQGYAKRSGGMGSRGGRQHMDGGRGFQSRSVAQAQPSTPRSPPKMDTNNPSRVNGSRNEAHSADKSQIVGEMSAVSASVPSTLAQGPGPQSQPPQSAAPKISASLLPSLTPQAPIPITQVRHPLPQSQPQPSPPTQPQPAAPSQAPSQVKSPSAAALGGGDSGKEATTPSEGAQAAPTTGAAAVARTTKTGEFMDFSRNLIIKYPNQDGPEEQAGANTPKEGGAAAKEEEPQAEKGATGVEGDKPVEKKKYTLNPNAEEFKPQSKPMPPPAVSQAPTPPRPSLPQSPSVILSQQPYYIPFNPAAMQGAPPQPQPAASRQYSKRAMVSMTQPNRPDFSVSAQSVTGAPLMAQAAPHQYNPPPGYIMSHFPQVAQQNMQMLPSRVMNPTPMSLSHQTMPGADPMQATSQHAMNPQMFMPPHHATPMPAHLPSHVPSHVPMPAHVPHAMAGQQNQAMQSMTPVTGPPNPGSQHNVGHQQAPPTSGTPQPGQMSYAQINLPSHLGHQNQHTTSPQPMQPYGMATSHAGPQQHIQQHGQQYSFPQQSQPTSSQPMQPYGTSQPGQHHTVVVMPPLQNPMGAHQFGSMPMPAHANATPVMNVHSGIPASAASGLPHHMPFIPHHSTVSTQHGHQVQGFPQAQ